MNKKVVLIAGLLVAAGTVAAMSAPSFRGQRHGTVFDDLLDGIGRAGQRISQRLSAAGVDAVSPREGERNRAYSRSDDRREGGIDAADGEPGARRSKRAMQNLGADAGSELAKDAFGRAGKMRFGRQSDGDATAEEETSQPRVRSVRQFAEREQSTEDRRESRRRGSSAAVGMERRTDQLFRTLDKNGDGVIDTAELAFAFKRLDADGDGKVTREEFAQLARERSAKLDDDDDDVNADAGSQRERRAGGPSK